MTSRGKKVSVVQREQRIFTVITTAIVRLHVSVFSEDLLHIMSLFNWNRGGFSSARDSKVFNPRTGAARC